MICAVEGWAARSELRRLSPETVSVLEIDVRLTVAGVVSRGGWPIGDALVVLTEAAGESVGATRTDNEVHYELGLPPLGRYVLTALDPHTGVAESQHVVISAQRRRFSVVWPPLPEPEEAEAPTSTSPSVARCQSAGYGGSP